MKEPGRKLKKDISESYLFLSGQSDVEEVH